MFASGNDLNERRLAAIKYAQVIKGVLETFKREEELSKRYTRRNLIVDLETCDRVINISEFIKNVNNCVSSMREQLEQEVDLLKKAFSDKEKKPNEELMKVADTLKDIQSAKNDLDDVVTGKMDEKAKPVQKMIESAISLLGDSKLVTKPLPEITKQMKSKIEKLKADYKVIRERLNSENTKESEQIERMKKLAQTMKDQQDILSGVREKIEGKDSQNGPETKMAPKSKSSAIFNSGRETTGNSRIVDNSLITDGSLRQARERPVYCVSGEVTLSSTWQFLPWWGKLLSVLTCGIALYIAYWWNLQEVSEKSLTVAPSPHPSSSVDSLERSSSKSTTITPPVRNNPKNGTGQRSVIVRNISKTFEDHPSKELSPSSSALWGFEPSASVTPPSTTTTAPSLVKEGSLQPNPFLECQQNSLDLCVGKPQQGVNNKPR